MKTKAVTNLFSVLINAKPEDVFAYVSDLARHSEWNEGLKIEVVTSGPASVGSQYRSWGKPAYLPNEIEITEFQPPTRFAFVAKQSGFNDVNHEFTVHPKDGGTLIERALITGRTLIGRLVLWPLYGRPAMNKCMAALKAQMERSKV